MRNATCRSAERLPKLVVRPPAGRGERPEVSQREPHSEGAGHGAIAALLRGFLQREQGLGLEMVSGETHAP